MAAMVTTFSRNSAGWGCGAERSPREYLPDQRRLDYEIETGQYLGALIAGQYQNIVPHSNDVAQNPLGGLIAGTVGASPGEDTIAALQETTGSGAHRVSVPVPGGGSEVPFSFFAKSAHRTGLYIGLRFGGIYRLATVDLSTFEVGAINIAGAAFGVAIDVVTQAAAEFVWVAGRFTNTDTAIANAYLGVLGDDLNNMDYPGSGEDALFVWGLNIGQPNYPIWQYAPTYGAANTVAPDFLDAPTGPWYRPGPSTIRAAYRVSRDPGQPVVLSTAGGVRVYQGDDGRPVLDGPGELVHNAGANPQPGDRIDIRWLLDAPAVDRWAIGRDYDDSHWLNSHIIDVIYERRRLSVDEARAELGL